MPSWPRLRLRRVNSVSRRTAAQEMLARRAARASLAGFVQFTKPDYVCKPFNEALARTLDAFAAREWVSCAERLPEGECSVLVIWAIGVFTNIDHSPHEATFYPVDRFDRANYFVIGGGFNPARAFSHWMPMPMPPSQ